MGRLDDNPTLLQALHNNTPFVYAHLIKFERPSKDIFKVSKNSFKSKKANNYAYITDAGYDISFDDGSTDFEGTANGVQNYVANRVTSVGSFTDTIDLKIANVSLKLDATPIDTSLSGEFAVLSDGASILIESTTSLADAGFRPGDIVKFTSGVNATESYRVNLIKNSGKTLVTTPINGRGIVAAATGTGSSSNTLTLAQANSNIVAGMPISGGVFDSLSRTVQSVSGTTITLSAALPVMSSSYNYTFGRVTKAHTFIPLTLKLDSQEILGILHSTAAERHYFTNKSITIYKAFFYGDAPHTFIGSPVKIFEGTITSASFEEDPSSGTSITWQASTFMNSFNRVNGRITSDAIHRAVTGNRGQPLHTHREEYAYDLGFMHAENSVSALVNYTDTETYMKYRKKKMGPFGMFGSTRVPYEATRIVERELDLRFDLQAKYLPVVYGVQKIPGIPVFTDIAPQTTATNNAIFVFTAHALCEGPIQGVLNYYVDGESKIALDPEDMKARSSTGDGKTQAEVTESAASENVEVTGDISAGDVAGGEPTSSLVTLLASQVTLDGTTTVVLTGIHPGIKVGEGVFGAGIVGNSTITNIVENDDGNTELTLSIATQSGVSASGSYMFDNVVHTKIDTGFGSGWAYIPASATTGETITNADTVIQAAIDAADAAGVDVTSEEVLNGASISGFEADFIRNNPVSAGAYQQLSTTSQSGYTHGQMEATQKPVQVLEFHMGLGLQDASSLLTTQSLSTSIGTNTSYPPTPAGGFLSQDRTDRKSRAAYWGPAHTLLDTAYVAAANTLNAEDTTIPELEYIVKGKMINCYNYDGSFEHSGLGHYGTEAHTNFMVGDVVQIKTAIPFTSKAGTSYAAGANLLGTPNTRIIEKFEVFQNEDDAVKYRYRWDITADEVSLLTEAKRFYMERSGNKWHMLTYDAEDIGELITDAPGATPVTVAERFTAKVTRTSTSGSFVGTLSEISVATISDYTLTDCNVVLYVISDTDVYSDIGTGGYSYSTSIFKANIVAVGSNYELRIADLKGDRDIPNDTKVFIVDQFKLSTSASSTDDYYNGVNYKAVAFYETGVMNDTGRAGKSFPMPMKVLDYVGSTRKITISLSSIHGVPPIGTIINFSTFATIQRQNKLEEMLGDIGSGDVRSSINYALITLDYLTNTRYGAGIPFDQIDLDSFLLAAQECDTQSEVTVHINGTSSLLTVGSKWRNPLINSNGAEYWQGTIKSLKTFNGDTFVTFTNVVGKLTHKANSFQTRQIGELVYSETANDNNLRKITTAGSQRDPATTTVQAPRKYNSNGNPTAYFPVEIFTKDRLHADNLGATLFNRNSSAIAQNDPALLLHSLANSNDTVSIKQGVGNPIRTETGESGYSFYDSDAVTYWKFQGWEAPKQRYATRHQGGLTIDTSRPVLDNLKGILNHFNGMLFTAGGKFHLKVEAARDSAGQESDANFDDDNSLLDIKTRYITDEDVIGKISLKDEGFSKSYNTVNASISDPKLHFDDRSVSYFVGEYKDQDSGIERSANFSMPGITNYFNARMAAKQVLDKSRLTRSISFEMRPVGTQILAGDLIRVKYPRFGWNTGSEVLFRVTSVTLKPNCLVGISASEYSDDVYLITRNTKSRFFSDSNVTPLRKIPSVPVFSTPSSASNSSPIVLNWTASKGIDFANGGYEIWRASSLGNAATPITAHASLLAEVPATQTTFTDVKAESTTLQTFYYWIRAFNISQQQNTSAKVRAPRRYYSAFNDDASGGQSKVVNAALKALEESLTMSFSTNGITVPADEDGNNPDFSSVNGQITVEIGNNDITNQVTGFTKSNFSNITTSQFSINASGAYTITGMTGTTASLDVTAAIPANAITGLSTATTITKKFTLNKTKEGAKARVVTLSGIAFNYDETGTLTGPANATTTATALNTSGTVFFEFLVNGSSLQNSTSNTFQYTPQSSFANMASQVIQVKLREGSNSSTPLATGSLVPTAFRRGADGAAGAAGAPGAQGAAGLRTVQGYLYYEKTSSGAPPAPSGTTYTFSTGVVSGSGINDSGTTNVWRNSPTTQDATSSNTFWSVRYFGTESSAGSSTITVSYSSVVASITFNGVVTFSGGTLTDGSNSTTPLEASDVGASGNTTIDGGRITTGSITSQNHSGTGDGSGFATAGTKINLNNGTISSKEFRIDSSGNASFSGDLSAAGGTFSGSLVVGGTSTAVSTVVAGAAAGATANQSTNAQILAGNVTGTIDGTAVATIKSGAAAGASALQDGATGVELSLNDGAVGPVTIDPSGKLFQGAGTFNNTNTGFYLDSSGNFSLKNKLAFNGSVLALDGEFSAGTGNSIFKATSTGLQLGHATFNSAPFRVTSAGVLTATGATISGAITATSLSLSSGVTVDFAKVSGSTKPADNATANRSDTATDTAVNQANKTAGKVGGVTITASKIHLGAGTHANSNTSFYVDSSGNFSLGDKLSWNGTTLSVEGNLTISNANNINLSDFNNDEGFTDDSAADAAAATATTANNTATAAAGTANTANSKSSNFNTSGNINGGITIISGGSITVGNIVIDGNNSRILISD